MNIYDLLLIPLLFGLLGFIEPCSMGLNIIFLNKINTMSRGKRLRETLLFTLVRGFFFALVGLSAAFIGSRLIVIQSSFFVILGVVYILLGIFTIINMYLPILSCNLNLSRYLKSRGSLALGVIFGLVIPACAISFVIALIGRALLIGDIIGGFVTLFVFGVALSSPLIVLTFFEKSNEMLMKIFKWIQRIPWLAGATLIIVGLLTVLSSSWWAGALGLVE